MATAEGKKGKAHPAQSNGQEIAVCLFLLAISPVPLLAEYGRAGYTEKPWSFKTLPFGLPAGIEIVLPLKKVKRETAGRMV